MQGGDRQASERLFERLHEDLRGRAHRMLRGERKVTLQTTALVHEAWLKLTGGETAEWSDQAHFLKVAARAMRSVLVDHARSRGAEKRGGRRLRFSLDDVVATYEESAVDLVALDGALERLDAFDPQLAALVDLRFFAGLGLEETARVLEVSPSTVERGWRTARTWLRGEL